MSRDLLEVMKQDPRLKPLHEAVKALSESPSGWLTSRLIHLEEQTLEPVTITFPVIDKANPKFITAWQVAATSITWPTFEPQSVEGQ